MRHALKTALAAMLLVLSSGAGRALAAECPRGAPLAATFLQPRADDVKRDPAAWDELFQETAALGIGEVFLQWSATGAYLDYGQIRFPEQPSQLAKQMLDRASAHGLRVWLGLAYTSEWWQRIDRSRSVDSVNVYLRRRLVTNLAAAKDLAPLAQEHAAFAGWYVSDEIDDRNWLGPDRQKVLVDYLGSLASGLAKLTPGKRISISGFASGFADPASLAHQWFAILGAAPIDLVLLQDGIGAHHLTLEELAIVVPPLREAIARRQRELGIVVELFTQTGGPPIDQGPFKAVPAPLDRVQKQIAVAKRWASGPVVAFSVPDYMSTFGGSAAATLYSAFSRWERSCQATRR